MDTTEALEKALDDLNSDRYLGVWSIDLLKNLNALGFDIVAIPDPTIPAAGFGDVAESQKPTYDELVEALKKALDAMDGTSITVNTGLMDSEIRLIDSILDRLK